MKEHIAHSGTWPIALIVIVGVSWLLYRYLAPRNWREWAGAVSCRRSSSTCMPK